MLMKAPKEFSWVAFFVPIGVMVLLGIYKLEKTTDVSDVRYFLISSFLLVRFIIYNFSERYFFMNCYVPPPPPPKALFSPRPCEHIGHRKSVRTFFFQGISQPCMNNRKVLYTLQEVRQV